MHHILNVLLLYLGEFFSQKKQISNVLIDLKGESLIYWQTDFILIMS